MTQTRRNLYSCTTTSIYTAEELDIMNFPRLCMQRSNIKDKPIINIVKWRETYVTSKRRHGQNHEEKKKR